MKLSLQNISNVLKDVINALKARNLNQNSLILDELKKMANVNKDNCLITSPLASIFLNLPNSCSSFFFLVPSWSWWRSEKLVELAPWLNKNCSCKANIKLLSTVYSLTKYSCITKMTRLHVPGFHETNHSAVSLISSSNYPPITHNLNSITICAFYFFPIYYYKTEDLEKLWSTVRRFFHFFKIGKINLIFFILIFY